MIVSLNVTIFTEKFLETREKYFTLVLASEYVVNNKLQNLAYFDESGVQQWYLKDFSGNFQYFNETGPLDVWLKENKINYMMITDEMGYQITKINDYRNFIKQLDVVKEFNSDFF